MSELLVQSQSRGRSPLVRVLHAAAIGAVILLLAAFTIQQLWTPDTWWQLRTGQLIWENRAFPTTDVYSYTAAENQWIELRWIFCLVEYFAWRIGGSSMIVLLQFIAAATVLGVIALSTPRATGTWLGVLMLALCIITASSRFAARPELVTFIMMSVFLVTLNRTANSSNAKLGYILPFLQIVWVNAHTLFVMGPVLAWMFAFSDVAQRMLAKWRGETPAIFNPHLFVIALLTTAACVVNPWGMDGALFPLILFSEIQKDSVLGHAIEEFRSPLQMGRLTWELMTAIALCIAAAATFALNWRRTNVARLVIFVAHVYLAAVAVRNIGLFAVAATWIAMQNIDDFLATATPSSSRKLFSNAISIATCAAILVGSCGLAWYVATDRFMVRFEAALAFGLGTAEWTVPDSAVNFLLDNNLQPNLMHSIADGAYLIWKAHDHYKVHVDGRLEVYGEKFLSRYMQGQQSDWDEYANQFNINTVIVQSDRMAWLTRTLLKRKDWALVHLDSRDVVFVRDIPQHKEVIAKYRIDLAAPWQARETEPDEARSALAKSLGCVARPWYSFGMARTFVLMESLDNAIRYLQRAIEVAPDHADARLMLAQIYRSRDRENEARELTANLAVSVAKQAWADELLADLYALAGRNADALAVLEQAAAALKEDADLWHKFAALSAAANDWPRARRAYAHIMQLRPDSADARIQHGLSCERTGNRAAAIESYRAALAIEPRLPGVHNQLGIVLAQTGDLRNAIASFEMALRIDPSFESAKRNLDLARRAMQAPSTQPSG